MPDMGGLLCVNGLQHIFVMTTWVSSGATSFWASEMMCPTCGTVVYRDDTRDPWHWVTGTQQ